MSTIDENQIRERLERLSKIEPDREAAERAVKRVRDTLAVDEGRQRRVGLAPPSWIGGLKPTLNFVKLAAAAVVLIAAGVVAGRFSAQPLDDESLRAALESSLKSSLEPAIRQAVLAEADSRWQSAFKASCDQLKDELARQVRYDLTQVVAQTLAAAGTQTDQRLKELIALIEAARIQDRRRIEEALDHIERQFGSGLVTLAARTDELQRLEHN
jgi:hypothetical protein